MFRKIRRLKGLKEYYGYFMMMVCPALLSDRLQMEMQYLWRTGRHLDLNHPKTFNEKIQWMKLYDRNPLYVKLVDKNQVKEWVAEKIGREYVIPTIDVYKSADEINFDTLPDRFVLKCNHDSGSVRICTNKQTFDKDGARAFFKERLKYDTYAVCGEWAYKDVPRCIIAEKYMEEKGQTDLMDYKWFCFNGEPKIMYMSRDHAQDARTDFFDMDFNHLPIRMQAPPSDVLPSKPKEFEKMKYLASILSQNIPQVRVDFYVINGQIYFGEMTFYHCGGMVDVKPYEWNVKMGDMIKLPRKIKNNEKLTHRRL